MVEEKVEAEMDEHPIVLNHPLVPIKGVFADEPEESWNSFQQSIEEYRQEVDARFNSDAPDALNTRQRAERAARRMNELSLISTTLSTVEYRIQQVADIIAAEFEK